VANPRAAGARSVNYKKLEKMTTILPGTDDFPPGHKHHGKNVLWDLSDAELTEAATEALAKTNLRLARRLLDIMAIKSGRPSGPF
jgi:hypothetical protein